jgi:DNA polymerase III subunit beta
MNIIIEKTRILQPIGKVVGITEKRSIMPILSNILLSLGPEGCTVYCTDLEISGIAFLDIVTEESKKMVVHGRKFVDILREMDAGDINITVEENVLAMRQKQTEFVIALQDPDEFPEVRELKGVEEFIVSSEILRDMIARVIFAVSTDEARHVLTGMFMEGKDGVLKVVGTDGFRMAMYQREIDGIKDFKGVIIPKRCMLEIDRVFEDGGELVISLDEKQIQFKSEKILIMSRIIEGNFPDYENVIPSNKNVAVVDRDVFLKGLKKVSAILGRAEPIRVTLKAETLEIEAESDVGRAKEVISLQYEGEELTMNFNVRFVMDVIQHCGGDKICMRVPSTYGSVLIEDMVDSNYKNIVMPIRV